MLAVPHACSPSGQTRWLWHSPRTGLAAAACKQTSWQSQHLSCLYLGAGSGDSSAFCPWEDGGSWGQQSPALFLKQILLAGSFAQPDLWKTGELLLLES